MINLNEDKFQDIKMRVERLYRRYSKYETLSKGQVVSKILDDLDTKFLEDPAKEVAAYACLALLNKDNEEILSYLKREYYSWNEYYGADFSLEVDLNNEEFDFFDVKSLEEKVIAGVM